MLSKCLSMVNMPFAEHYSTYSQWVATCHFVSTFDDEIDSLRTFDVDTQRTLEEVSAINLLPAHEFPTDKDAIERFRSQWRERFEVRRDPEHIYQQVSKNTLPSGIEYWQPLFFAEPLPSLFEYLPANTLFVSQNLQEPAERFQQDTCSSVMKAVVLTQCAHCFLLPSYG